MNAMQEQAHENDVASNADGSLSAEALRAANVHPESGLATDFLNPFNEYIMLAELVSEGTLPGDVLDAWQPIDYESHFAGAGFAGAATVLAAYRQLEHEARFNFERETNTLIDLILEHQESAGRAGELLKRIRCRRDRVAAIIAGADAHSGCQDGNAQEEIDKLFA